MKNLVFFESTNNDGQVVEKENQPQQCDSVSREVTTPCWIGGGELVLVLEQKATGAGSFWCWCSLGNTFGNLEKNCLVQNSPQICKSCRNGKSLGG